MIYAYLQSILTCVIFIIIIFGKNQPTEQWCKVTLLTIHFITIQRTWSAAKSGQPFYVSPWISYFPTN